jgi:hypothetical protein
MAQWSGAGGVRNKRAPDIVPKTKLENSVVPGWTLYEVRK